MTHRLCDVQRKLCEEISQLSVYTVYDYAIKDISMHPMEMKGHGTEYDYIYILFIKYRLYNNTTRTEF